MPLWEKLESGIKRVVAVWHRRSGKDDVGLHWTALQAVQKPANYWYMLPQANQARKAVWDAVDSHSGRRRIDWAFPEEIREATRDNDMLIRIKGGATWQVVGSDNWNALIGSPPLGIVYSEYALSDPNSWSFLRPILEENGGWAIFNSTPRGRNHLHGLYELGLTEPGWYSQKLTVADTKALTLEQLETIRRQLAKERGDDEADNLIQQEYYCSFDAAIPGSYYGRLMAQAEAKGQFTSIPVDPRTPVITAWDLGVGDSTAIWFVQRKGHDLRIIDYYESSGVGADHYARVLKEKGYTYERHILPHDAHDREWGNNASSRVDTLRSLGVRPHVVLPRASVDDGINAARILLTYALFDRTRCERGIAALRQYQRTWDDKLKTFSLKPLHDWTSHACFVGSTQVLTHYGMQQMIDLPQTGEVLTSCGWKRYINPHRTIRNAPLVEVRFVGGYTVKCTPDHLFKTVSGWISAEHLQPGSVIQSGSTRSRSISTAVSTACGRVTRTCLAAAKSFIGMSGLQPSGLFLRTVTSTIATMTPSTIGFQISNAWTPLSIFRRRGIDRTGQALTSRLWLNSERPSGTNPRLADCGISVTRSEVKAGPSGRESINPASSVRRNFLHSFAQAIRSTIAALTAKPLIIESVRPLEQCEDVWDLTVPDLHEFALANGALVHNSDAFRYLAQGLKDVKSPTSTRQKYAVT